MLVRDCQLIVLNINVKVENEQQSPVTDAQVTIYSEKSSCPQGESFNLVEETDEYGSVHFGPLETSPGDTLHLQIVAEGYEVYEYSIDASLVVLGNWLFVLEKNKN